MTERPRPNWLRRAGILMAGVGAIAYGHSSINIITNNARIGVIEDITASLPHTSSRELARINDTNVIYKAKLERNIDVFAGSGLLMLEGAIIFAYIAPRKNTPKQQGSQD